MISQAVILCGGRATGFGEPIAETPKPLLPVAGAPILDRVLFELGRHGIRRIMLLAGFGAGKIVEYAAATQLKARFALDIEVAIAPEPGGRGGALGHARDRLEESFLLLNGDSWFDINLLDLAARLARDPAALGALALRRLNDASRFGVVNLVEERIAGFAEPPHAPGPGLVSGGVYALRRAVVDGLADGERSIAMLSRVLPRPAGCAAFAMADTLSRSACLTLSRARNMKYPNGSGAQRFFSTATACSTTMTGISARQPGSAGSRGRATR